VTGLPQHQQSQEWSFQKNKQQKKHKVVKKLRLAEDRYTLQVHIFSNGATN
jgi:hypothetical protein